MKTGINIPCVFSVLIAVLGLMLDCQVTAQTFTTLHGFTALNNATNSEGVRPTAGLILSGNTLYGTAVYGGTSGNGTVFAVNTDGSGFTNLHNLTATRTNSSLAFTNADGVRPAAELILLGDTLYGTAEGGGTSGSGTVFAVKTNGTGFTNLHSFTAVSSPRINSDGVYPGAGLILINNTLYGTAVYGGTSGNGTVFAVNTDGTGFTNLHTFTGSSGGANPYAGLVLSGSTLYGTATIGGSSFDGTVFAVNTDGTGFTNLHSFIGSDGASPNAALILSGNRLYGTTLHGGISTSCLQGCGTVFAVNTDGTGFTNLYSFTADSGRGNGDGANPRAGLVLSGDTLYGTAASGGSWNNGTVFAVKVNGTGFTNLHSFTVNSYPNINSDGINPIGGLVLSGDTLYGTTEYGGTTGNGTVFSISFAPQLTIISSGADIIVTWPTNVAGFDYTGYTLQFTTNLVSPVWTTNSPAPVVVNGQNTVTNPISGTQQFFRLAQ